MQTVSSRIWTWFADSISNDDDRFAKNASFMQAIILLSMVLKQVWSLLWSVSFYKYLILFTLPLLSGRIWHKVNF